MARRLFIASSANARLKALRRLARKGSRELCVVDGARAVRAALAHVPVVELYVAPALMFGEQQRALLRDAEEKGLTVVEVDATAFATLTPHSRPDGIVAVVERPCTTLAPDRIPAHALVVVAVAIERPGNLGTIVRTACAAGAGALIVADGCTDAFHPDVVRGSVGAVFDTALLCGATVEAIACLRECGARVLAATPTGETTHTSADYRGTCAIAFGSERHGLPATWLEQADERVAIPMPGRGDSLNVAVAAGIVIFEAVRRR